jgi:DNA polymerase III delta prime subunit
MPGQFTWQKSFLHAVRTRDVVILHGNIRDRYICRDDRHSFEDSFDDVLVRLLSTIGLRTLRRFDPHLKAAELKLGEAGIVVSAPLEDFGAPSFNDTSDAAIARIFSELTGTAQLQVWLLKQMHNLLPYRSGYSAQDNLRLSALQNMIERITPGNKLLLCYLSDTQVPVELVQQLHRVAFVKVPLPDFDERCDFWQRSVDPSLAVDLAKLTDGLALSSLYRVRELGRARAAANQDLAAQSLRDWERVISLFKFGEGEDRYRQITVAQLDHAFEFFHQEEGIQGQDEAVSQAIAMLWKARTHVSALLRAGPAGAPRGCLFFCGPSGVGKTMLAKKIAKFVFGSEDSFIRIDMSEYQQDFTVSRLIGAPPGYVGHEAGGTLTNAIAERPFSVVLFDEIEKANRRLFDLFLQLLSDGRLTDSRGQTVFFSEAIIVFTSNLGTRSEEVAQLAEARQSGDPARVREHFVRAVRNFFRYEISRPELLNRIGNNIVPFNYLDQRDVLARTVKFYLETLKRNFDEEYTARRLTLSVDADAVADFLVDERGAAIGEFGGKAVLNALDDALMPLLARRLLMLERTPAPGPVVLRVDVGVEGGTRRIRVRQ